MTTVNFLQKARRTLVAMRKATIDAFLLTLFAFFFLVVTGFLFTYPLLIILIYVLAYLIAVLLRLRKATHAPIAAYDREQSIEIGRILYAGMAEPLQQMPSE